MLNILLIYHHNDEVLKTTNDKRHLVNFNRHRMFRFLFHYVLWMTGSVVITHYSFFFQVPRRVLLICIRANKMPSKQHRSVKCLIAAFPVVPFTLIVWYMLQKECAGKSLASTSAGKTQKLHPFCRKAAARSAYLALFFS